MKKKLVIYMFTTLIISLSFVITLFIFITNCQYVDNLKSDLKDNNKIAMAMIEDNSIDNKWKTLHNVFKNNQIRMTYISKNGKVLFDSQVNINKLDNHNNREEVINARKNKSDYSTRLSNSTNNNSMYYANLLEDGSIIRSSIKTNVIKGFESRYLRYYIYVALLAAIISFVFASKLSIGITKPIKDLEFITSRIAAGELDRRVNISAQDEIGELGNTFNNMAEKLQLTINDALDKQNKLEAILKSMDSGIIAIDKNFRVIMINPYAKEIFGVDRNIIGENLLDNIKNFELEDIFKNKIDDYAEMKILWPKERELRLKIADINNGKQLIGIVAVVQDVTDIKKLENMRSQFVANVSHELKTPLTSIKGFAETLKYVDDNNHKDKFLNIINDEADRLTRLIEDILILSDIENNKDMKTDFIDVNETIKNIYCLMENVALQKDITMSIEEGDVHHIIGDKDRFKQMVINLIDNAIKYTENGGKVLVGSKKENNNCVIWVEDTGVGILKEHIDRLFERFYRVDKARSRAEGGTGLGLAIVKHIVLGFNGTIKVESTVGVGSKFIVTIPLATHNEI